MIVAFAEKLLALLTFVSYLSYNLTEISWLCYALFPRIKLVIIIYMWEVIPSSLFLCNFYKAPNVGQIALCPFSHYHYKLGKSRSY